MITKNENIQSANSWAQIRGRLIVNLQMKNVSKTECRADSTLNLKERKLFKDIDTVGINHAIAEQ